MRIFSLVVSLLLCSLLAGAELAVTVSPVQITGQKAIVLLAIRNNFGEKVESARAAVFLLDEKGKMVGQGTRWVIGGGKDKAGLVAGATNIFHFVVTTDKPVTATNLTARVNFSRLVLEGGKVVEIKGNVVVKDAEK